MQRTDAGIAAPGKGHALGATHADQLIVDQIGRHADQGQAFPFLADHFVSGGKRNQMREAFHRNGVAVFHIGFDRICEREKFRHQLTWFRYSY
jgi:hypothetical protein